MRQVPPTLRIGSPVVEEGNAPFNNYPTPPRRASVSRNGSFPVVPSQPTFAGPSVNTYDNGSDRQRWYRTSFTPVHEPGPSSLEAPVILSPPHGTGYDPAAERFLTRSPRHSITSSRTRSLLNRLGTPSRTARVGAVEREHSITQAGLAAEYERLESQGDRRAGEIGSGMQSVIDAPFVGPTHPPIMHRRGSSIVPGNARSAAQRVAEERGEITAVAGVCSLATTGFDLQSQSVSLRSLAATSTRMSSTRPCSSRKLILVDISWYTYFFTYFRDKV